MYKVMIVDDDRVTVDLLKMLLELDGFDISVVRMGGEVLSEAQAVRPDVLLIDYHLMDMKGDDVVRQLRASADFASTPVIITSGMDVEDAALSAGANKFLLKPFEPSDLPILFNGLLGGG